jgi:hypothetical protein
VDVEVPGGGSGNVQSQGVSGLHNKPAGCGASEAYASGPDGEEEEDDVQLKIIFIVRSQCK